MNSLTAIAAEHGHEGEDEDWESDMKSWNSDEVRLLLPFVFIDKMYLN